MCQKQNHKIRKCETADRATKAQPQSRHCEILDVHNISSCYNVPEILWQKSKARISLVSTYLLLNLSSDGNSAAEIHSENFHNLSTSQLIFWRKFCCGIPQLEFQHRLYTVESAMFKYLTRDSLTIMKTYDCCTLPMKIWECYLRPWQENFSGTWTKSHILHFNISTGSTSKPILKVLLVPNVDHCNDTTFWSCGFFRDCCVWNFSTIPVWDKNCFDFCGCCTASFMAQKDAKSFLLH